MAEQDWLGKDFYAVLGVSKDADDKEISKAFRKLARKYHPDSHPGDAAAEEKFKEISEAYEVLSNKTKIRCNPLFRCWRRSLCRRIGGWRIRRYFRFNVRRHGVRSWRILVHELRRH